MLFLKKNGICFIIFYINLLKRLHNSKKCCTFVGVLLLSAMGI